MEAVPRSVQIHKHHLNAVVMLATLLTQMDCLAEVHITNSHASILLPVAAYRISIEAEIL